MFDAFRRNRDHRSANSSFGGYSIESATWHGTLHYIEEIRRASRPVESLTPAALAQIAARIAADAPNHVGEMPWEVEQFIREHAQYAVDGEPVDPAHDALQRSAPADMMRDAHLYADAALAALNAALQSPEPDGEGTIEPTRDAHLYADALLSVLDDKLKQETNETQRRGP